MVCWRHLRRVCFEKPHPRDRDTPSGLGGKGRAAWPVQLSDFLSGAAYRPCSSSAAFRSLSPRH